MNVSRDSLCKTFSKIMLFTIAVVLYKKNASTTTVSVFPRLRLTPQISGLFPTPFQPHRPHVSTVVSDQWKKALGTWDSLTGWEKKIEVLYIKFSTYFSYVPFVVF